MNDEFLKGILRRHKRDLILAMTFAVKELRGGYDAQPVEEVYELAEAAFHGHGEDLFSGNFQPLVALAETLARRAARRRLRLHEVMRAAHSYKRAVVPVLISECWEDRDALVKFLMRVERSVDRFIVNLAQAYLLHAKDVLASEPVEFPVWSGPLERHAILEEVTQP